MKQHRTLAALAIGSLIAISLSATPVAAKDADVSAISGISALSPEVAATAKGNSVEAQQDALARYWTPDRMKNAKPDSELPSVKTRTAPDQSAAKSKPQGPAVRIGGSSAAAPSISDVSSDAYYPGYPVGHPVARTLGKVFFTAGGLNYVCSGTIVNTEGKSAVWTAAHCNTSGTTWHYNWTFVPNYSYGSAPYGYWYAYQLWSTTAFFYNNNDFANDVGSAIMYRNSGWRIADYFGAQGIAWNYPIGQYAYAFGYPQGAPFDGQALVAESGATYNGGGGTIYMVNYMTGGSSGGGWLSWFDGNWGYLNGHNDFKYTAYPQYMFSPYYGNQVAAVYNAVRNIST